MLRVHANLSQFSGNDRKIENDVKKRIKQIRQAADQLRGLLSDVVPRCFLSSTAEAAAYSKYLEEATEKQDPASREFARVLRGEACPWDHYARYFDSRYRDAPTLEPLETIFAKLDPDAIRAQVRADARALAAGPQAAALQAPGASTSTSAPTTAVIGAHIDTAGVTHSEGKRKTSLARVDLVPGSGRFTVNGQPLATYFVEPAVREAALQPLLAAGAAAAYDISVSVHGGGLSGQAQAVRTAVARALVVVRPALAGRLAELTRWDGRVVERKKPARKGARRGFQWVKR